MMSIVRDFIGGKSKERYLLVMGIISGAIIIASIWYIIILFSKILLIDQSLHGYYQRFSLYQEGIRNYPSSEREAFLNNQSKQLRDSVAKLREYPIFGDQIIDADISKITPLKFKEELFNVKKKLRERARQNNVLIPDDIGFMQWERELPPQLKLHTIFQSLEIMEAVNDMAIDARVSEIEKVSIAESIVHVHDTEPNKEAYTTREVRVRLKGNSASIIRFVYAVSRSPLLLNVTHMRMFNPEGYAKRRKRRTQQQSEPLEHSQSKRELLAAEFIIVSTTL